MSTDDRASVGGSWLRDVVRVVRQSRTATMGAVVFVVIVILAILAPWIAPYDPLAQVLSDATKPPSWEHWMGTDRLGRDILSRVLYGAQLSLAVGIGAVIVGCVLGLVVGMLAGFVRGWVDAVVMRAVDVMLAFPLYVVAMVLVGVLGSSLVVSMVAVGIATMPTFARLVRGQVLAVRELDFVTAARSIGATDRRIMIRHVLPQILGPVVVLATLTVGAAILVQASLSFIGLGPPPPAPTWGAMVYDGLSVLQRAPWVAVGPGIVITVVVLSLNLLGDGLRDALDPRMHQR